VPSRSLTVAIPALNEERNIAAAIGSVLEAAAAVPSLSVEIIVLDDGSTDRTAEIVEGLCRDHANVRLLRNPHNCGLGASLRRAIADGRGEKFLVVPGDNDMPRATLDLLFRSAYLADVVMCYFLNGEIRGRVRFVLSNLFLLAYTSLFDLYIQYINGPAVYPTAMLRALDLRSTRFSIVAEINVKLLRQGCTFAELPSNRQTGNRGSTSLSLRSLAETVHILSHLLAEVHFLNRQRFGSRPVRVPLSVMVAAPSPAGR
jgi:glycosyltransferase involved in cell wall biosynthesis